MTTTQVFATGIAMGESPRWHDGRLWVCDWLAGEVLAFTEDGERTVVHRIDGLPFSVEWLPDGREVLTTQDGVVVGPDLAPYGGTGRPWNEVVVDPRGHVFVNMPGSMPGQEPKPGVLAVITPDGRTRDVAGDLWFPNGMAVTPDGTTLVVAESHAHRLDRLHDRRGRLADGPPGLGRPRRGRRARRHLPRCGRRSLVCRRPQPTLRAGR